MTAVLPKEQPGQAVAVAEAPAEQQRPTIPFLRASFKHREPAFDVSQLMAANTVELGPFDVPAYGYIRNIFLVVTGTGGVLSTDALTADAPFSVLDTIELADPAGHSILYPVSGYELFLINKYGGYAAQSNPADHPDFSNSVNPTFVLRIPVEITGWDGYGSLANQNAAASFKVRIILAARTALATGGAMTAPTIRIRGYLDAWAKPSPQDLAGNPTQQEPPGHGTVQFWKRLREDVAVGSEQARVSHVGNFIRNIIVVGRTAAGARDNAVLPDPIRLELDGRLLTDEARILSRGLIREAYGFANDTGVLPFTYTDDQEGHAGFENRHLWLPTVQSSRLEIKGTVATAGTWNILINDVAPVAGR